MFRLVIALGLGMLPMAAQTSLVGVVIDGQGAAVPEAVVTARNADTSALRKTLSNSLGEYGMTQLPPGSYKVTVEKPGFRTYGADIVLQVNTPATLDVKLELGAVTEAVNVSAEMTVINT